MEKFIFSYRQIIDRKPSEEKSVEIMAKDLREASAKFHRFLYEEREEFCHLQMKVSKAPECASA